VLDLGCNTGYGAEILSRKAKSVIGADVSSNAIAAAKAQFGQSGIKFIEIDGQQLPFGPGEFDLIVSFQVIEHVVDYEAYIGEIKRVLAPGGIVVFTTPNAPLRLDKGMKPWNIFHVREFDSRELKVALDKFFKKVSVHGLYAKEPFYSVESNRVSRAKANARASADNGGGAPSEGRSVRSVVKQMVPESMRKMLKGWRYSLASSELATNRDPLDVVGESFFYRRDDLDAALDLLAICFDSADAVEPVIGLQKN
jgi:SAM-dependent methyltransferase